MKIADRTCLFARYQDITTDLRGQLNESVTTINVGSLKVGIYNFQLSNKDGVVGRKFIKK